MTAIHYEFSIYSFSHQTAKQKVCISKVWLRLEAYNYFTTIFFITVDAIFIIYFLSSTRDKFFRYKRTSCLIMKTIF